MKILAFSDLHLARARAADLVQASEAADLVIGAGDFCNMREGLAQAMALLDGISAPMLLVPGNAESADELAAVAPANATVLHGSGVTLEGLHFFGMGYGVPPTPFGEWSCDLDEDAATALLERCDKADVLILHSPPKGHVDLTSTGVSVGSVAIRDAIARVQPRLAVCGHIHDSWGQRSWIGRSEIVNLGPTVTWFEISP